MAILADLRAFNLMPIIQLSRVSTQKIRKRKVNYYEQSNLRHLPKYL